MNSVNYDEIGVWLPAIRSGTGTEVFTIRLAEALKKRGIKVEIAWLPRQAEYLPWLVPIPAVPSWVTVVHVNTWLHSRFIPKHLPVVATMHSAIYDDSLSPYKSFAQSIYHKFWIRYCERWCVKNSYKLTAVSHYVAKQATMYFDRKDIAVIHNWIDLNIFRPEEEKVESGTFSIIFVGTPSIRKGIDLLPKIMRALGDKYQLKLTAKINDVPEYPELPKNISVIERLNNDFDLANLYRSADLLIFPSRLEGFGLVVLEALACGLPVVATDSGALGEIVQNGISGFLCPQDDVEAFVGAVRKIASDRNLRMQMGISGRLNAMKNFSEDLMIEKYIQLYATKRSD